MQIGSGHALNKLIYSLLSVIPRKESDIFRHHSMCPATRLSLAQRKRDNTGILCHHPWPFRQKTADRPGLPLLHEEGTKGVVLNEKMEPTNETLSVPTKVRQYLQTPSLEIFLNNCYLVFITCYNSPGISCYMGNLAQENPA
jgi:hypothetical protein